jgi:hypothetical protein
MFVEENRDGKTKKSDYNRRYSGQDIEQKIEERFPPGIAVFRKINSAGNPDGDGPDNGGNDQEKSSDYRRKETINYFFFIRRPSSGLVSPNIRERLKEGMPLYSKKDRSTPMTPIRTIPDIHAKKVIPCSTKRFISSSRFQNTQVISGLAQPTW